MKTPASLTAALLLVGGAGAASAHEARINWGDLNMGTATGADSFDARVDAAARKLCRDARAPGRLLSDRAFCRAAVRTEALRLLPGAVQVEYARSRQSVVV